jgi:F-type H+-transporting ATPase subunit delta
MIVAERYAKSLMELAVQANVTEAVRADMKSVHTLFKENRDFALMLNSPVIKTDKKVNVLNAILKGKISDLTLSFIVLMTNKKRETILEQIAVAFDEQYKLNKSIFTAVITSAKGLDNATKQKVVDLIKSQTKGEVELKEMIDEKLIGGFVLTMGDKQIDKTVARQLSNMKKQLLNKGLN